MKKGRSVSGRRLQYGVCVLLVQLMIGCSRPEPTQDNSVTNTAQASAPAENAAVRTEANLIVAFGDSLYAGYHLRANEDLRPRSNASFGTRASMRAWSMQASRATPARRGSSAWPFTLDGLPRKPDLVLVGLGGNDMLRGLAPAATRSNLDAILAELKRRQIPAMLTGMLAAPNMGKDYAAAFNRIYPDLARKYGTGTLSILPGRR